MKDTPDPMTALREKLDCSWLDLIFREWFPEVVPPRALGTEEDNVKAYNYEQAKLAIRERVTQELEAAYTDRERLARIDELQQCWDNGVRNNSLEAEDAYITERLAQLAQPPQEQESHE